MQSSFLPQRFMPAKCENFVVGLNCKVSACKKKVHDIDQKIRLII